MNAWERLLDAVERMRARDKRAAAALYDAELVVKDAFENGVGVIVVRQKDGSIMITRSVLVPEGQAYLLNLTRTVPLVG